MWKKNRTGDRHLTSRHKKKGKKRIIIIIVLLVFVLPWAILIGFRDLIATIGMEKGLEKAFGAPAQVRNLHIGILNPGLTIQEVLIDDKNDITRYLVKTGLIQILFEVRPYLRERLISIPAMRFEEVRVGAPKPADQIVKAQKSSRKSEKSNNEQDESDDSKETPNMMQDILSSIDMEKLIGEYTTLESIDKFSENSSKLVVEGEEIISETSKEITRSYQDIQGITNSLSNTNDINTIRDNLAQVQAVINTTQNIRNTVDSAQKRTNALIAQGSSYAKNLTDSISKDSDRILSQIANPEELSMSLTQSITEDIINDKLAKYEGLIVAAFDAIEERINAPKKDVSEDTKKKKEPIDFRIQLFRISFGVGTVPFFSVESQNITDRLYKDKEPTSFNIVALPENTLQVSGNGEVTLHPDATTMFSTNFTAVGVPYTIESDLMEPIQLEKVEGLLKATGSLKLQRENRGEVSLGMETYDSEVQEIPNTQFGHSIADGIMKSEPIDMQVSTTIENKALTNITVTSGFFGRIASLVAQIIQEQIAELTKQLRADLEAEVKKQAEEKLGVSVDSLQGTYNAISAQQEKVDGLQAKANETLSNANKQVGEIVKREAEKAVQDATEKAKDAAKDAIKKTLPF